MQCRILCNRLQKSKNKLQRVQDLLDGPEICGLYHRQALSCHYFLLMLISKADLRLTKTIL
jgi:hypothetical protein